MKTPPLLVSVLALFALVSHAATRPAKPAASDDRVIAAVRAADDARIAATVAADRAGLEGIYADGLRYGHSSGRVDTKTSQIEGIVAGPNRYDGFEYKERTFAPVAPGMVLMTGRTVMQVTSKATGRKSALDLNFLAVWREENGRWRFLAWQSCRHPDASASK